MFLKIGHQNYDKKIELELDPFFNLGPPKRQCVMCMHRHFWWCVVGAITIVQCIFGALFLGLGCNIFWCCIFGAMHCQLYCTGLLPQWRIYFMLDYHKINEEY